MFHCPNTISSSWTLLPFMCSWLAAGQWAGKYATVDNHLVPILFKPLSFLHSCSFHWNVFFNYLSTLFFQFFLFATQCIEAGCLTAPPLWRRLRLLLGYHLWLHHTRKSIYVRTRPNWNYMYSTKWPRTLGMALRCQNRETKGTKQHYGLHVSVCISVHSPSVTVLGLLKKKN